MGTFYVLTVLRIELLKANEGTGKGSDRDMNEQSTGDFQGICCLPLFFTFNVSWLHVSIHSPSSGDLEDIRHF